MCNNPLRRMAEQTHAAHPKDFSSRYPKTYRQTAGLHAHSTTRRNLLLVVVLPATLP